MGMNTIGCPDAVLIHNPIMLQRERHVQISLVSEQNSDWLKHKKDTAMEQNWEFDKYF